MNEPQMINAAIAKFPQTFGLRAFPGKVFKIDSQSSYMGQAYWLQPDPQPGKPETFGPEEPILYVYVKSGAGEGDEWLAFSKAASRELAGQVVPLR